MLICDPDEPRTWFTSSRSETSSRQQMEHSGSARNPPPPKKAKKKKKNKKKTRRSGRNGNDRRLLTELRASALREESPREFPGQRRQLQGADFRRETGPTQRLPLRGARSSPKNPVGVGSEDACMDRNPASKIFRSGRGGGEGG